MCAASLCKYTAGDGKEKLGFITQKCEVIETVDIFKVALTLNLEHKMHSFSFN